MNGERRTVSGDDEAVTVIGTAGHVDHGKSTIVEALTGVHPDRWPHERARGLTIDLGFAHIELPSGAVASFVDVPGHVRYLPNMLAGAGGVAACLFVVAATEGWKPQSEEHLRILELLGVRHGIVVLSKCDLVDTATRARARRDIEDHVRGTMLEHARIVDASPKTGDGMAALVDALDELVRATPQAIDLGRPRLWVDRCFAVRGAGTVVTGTLVGGRIATGDHLVAEPLGAEVRVRGIESHHETVDAAGPGRRVALNISGVDHHSVRRGDAIVRPGQWLRATVVDARLGVLRDLGHAVSRRGAYVVHAGAAETPIRLRVLGSTAIAPGDSGVVRLHLARALPLVLGDRFVLREAGRGETVGGGTVLDPAPSRRAAQTAQSPPTGTVDDVVADRGWIDVDDLARATGAVRTPDVGHWAVDPAALEHAVRDLSARVRVAGSRGVDLGSLDDKERAVASSHPDLVVDGGRVTTVDAVDRLDRDPWLAALCASPFAPPAPAGVEAADLRELRRRGLIVGHDGVWFAASALVEATSIVAAMLDARPTGVTVAEVRERLATTRKYALPLLALMDDQGITRRDGDLRTAGPRLGARD